MSKGLEALEKTKSLAILRATGDFIAFECLEVFNIIKKELKIIWEKGVDVGFLKTCETVDQYNAYCWNDEEVNKKLTQEEFNLLKR